MSVFIQASIVAEQYIFYAEKSICICTYMFYLYAYVLCNSFKSKSEGRCVYKKIITLCLIKSRFIEINYWLFFQHLVGITDYLTFNSCYEICNLLDLFILQSFPNIFIFLKFDLFGILIINMTYITLISNPRASWN